MSRFGFGFEFGLKTGRPTLGLALAYGLFALTFRGPRQRFWQRMTATGVILGGLAMATDSRLRRPRLGLRDVLLGLLSAAGLYAVFQVGDRLARRLLRQGGQEIADIYALRQLRPQWEIAARLAAIVGPAEELFWRGYVMRPLTRRLGKWRGAAVASALYGGAHVVTGNLTLTGAATIAGLYWSVLGALGLPMPALIVSHVAWDIWIFLVQPTDAQA